MLLHSNHTGGNKNHKKTSSNLKIDTKVASFQLPLWADFHNNSLILYISAVNAFQLCVRPMLNERSGDKREELSNNNGVNHINSPILASCLREDRDGDIVRQWL